MRSVILLSSGLVGMLAFTAFTSGQQIVRENPVIASSLILQNTGETNGSDGITSLKFDGGRIEGKMGAANQAGIGLSDFYIEFCFQVTNTSNGEIDLNVGGFGQDSSSFFGAVNLRCGPKDGWSAKVGAGDQVSWQHIDGLKRIVTKAWYRFRFVGRSWGETNAYYNLSVSAPDARELTLTTTNLKIFGGSKGMIPRADRFSFDNIVKADHGYNIKEICVRAISAYKGPVVKGVDTTTLTGKVLCGYQGWFGAPGDGRSEASWRHWTKHQGAFVDGNVNVDLWPDVSELNPALRFSTGFKMPDGHPAQVFSSFNESTVLKHFQWMQNYGLDGVFVQRFANGLKNAPSLEHCNMVLANCRAGANRYGRTYAVMYDLSGLAAGQIDQVMDDWRALRQEMVITEDPAYLQHRGKPVVAIWGIGFNDHRDYTLAECKRLVEFFKSDPEVGGCTVMLGLPASWRELKRDAVADPMLLVVASMADIISPWTVGRYSNIEESVQYAESNLKPDLAWCRQHNIDYLPVVFPGFSWHNLKGGPLNQIPRLHGQFLWSQFCQIKRANVSMVYVAMFDEVDEGTAIFKCADIVPAGEKSQFLTFDGLSNDYYLSMVGAATKMLREAAPVGK